MTRRSAERSVCWISVIVIGCLSLLGACSDSPVTQVGDTVQGTTADTNAQDTAAEDTVAPDTAPEDTTAPDTTLEDTTLEDTGAPDVDDTGPPPLPACDPPLSLKANKTVAAIYDMVDLLPEGGSGKHYLSVVVNASGGKLNTLTNRYITGGTGGVTDTIEVTSPGCIGSATLDIEVAAVFDVVPKGVSMPPQSCFSFEVTGGSGNVTYEIIQPAAPTGTLSDVGMYTAGAGVTFEVIRVSDNETGEYAHVTVTVTPDALVKVEPLLVVMPVGSEFQLTVNGGSGQLDYVLPGDVATVADGVISAIGPGAATVQVVDPFVGCMGADGKTIMQSKFELVVVQAQELPNVRNGSSNGAVFASGHDINGDGYQDMVMGVPTLHYGTTKSGVVFIYKGTGTGLDPSPIRALSTSETGTGFGASVVLGDFNGDGQVDLAVGAPVARLKGYPYTGLLRVYYGVKDGFFEAQPSITLYGPQNWQGGTYQQQFTQALVACDLNGDGLTDLAVSAPGDEDLEKAPILFSQGSIHVFFGNVQGLPETAGQIVYGYLPDGAGQWKSGAGVGRSMVAGDFNGDSVCDLAAGNPGYTTATGTAGDDGIVAMYLGQKAVGADAGGLSPYPQRVWEAKDTNDFYTSKFGLRLASGDLDGDGMDELAVVQSPLNLLRVFTGQSMLGAPSQTVGAAADAQWTSALKGSSERGADVRIADINGDGVADLLLGYEGFASATGAVQLYAGKLNALPETTPSATVQSINGGDHLGTAVAALDDMDGDGFLDVVVMGRQVDSLGPDVGLPYYLPGSALANPAPAGDTTPSPLIALEYPGKTAGTRVGARGSLALLGDLNSDGYDDLAVGAPKQSTSIVGPDSGDVLVYLSTGAGTPTSPSFSMAGHVGHSSGWRIGNLVTSGGDFDGDGAADMVQVGYGSGYHTPWSLAGKAIDGTADPTNWNTPKDWTQVFVLEDACDDKWQQTMNPAPWTVGWSSVFIYGGKSGVVTEPNAMPPTFQFSAPPNSNLLGDIDVNGDGRDDIIVSGWGWNLDGYNQYYGGIALILGRDSIAGSDIHVICRPDWALLGTKGSGLGEQVVRIGDLNNDGCDDFATSQSRKIRVFYGFGAKCASETPLQTTLKFTDPGEALGLARLYSGSLYNSHDTNFSVASGGDLDSDGIPDLVAGTPNYTASFAYGGDREGVVWFLSGAWLAGLPTEAPNPDPTVGPAALTEFPDTVLVGPQVNVGFGFDVAIIPNLLPGGKPAVAVGSLQHGLGTHKNVGAVLIYAFDDATQKLATTPIGVVVGETHRPGSFMGTHVSARMHNGVSTLVVGADRGTPFTAENVVETGSAYIIDLPQLSN